MKKPITITLSAEVLAALDKAVGNRSEYIEWLIRQDLKIGFNPIKREPKK